MDTAFQVAFPGMDTTEDVLDLWSAAPEGGAFSAAALPGGLEQAGAYWLAELPDDPLEAQRLLSTRAAHLRLSQGALAQAGGLLRQDLQSIPPLQDGQAFSAPAYWPQASRDTPRGLLELALSQRFPEQVAFDGQESERIEEGLLAQASQIASGFFAQVQRLAGQFALVESSLGGRRLGLTRVSWLGDAQTWWVAGAGPQDYPLHQQVLAQALYTRQAWLSFALLFSAGVVQVAATLASGPFSLLAIWTTWNYLKKVVQKYRALHAPRSP